MKNRQSVPSALIALLLLAGAVPAPAQQSSTAAPPAAPAPATDHGGLREALERNEVVSFKSILDWIEAHYMGKVLEVELEDEAGEMLYEVDLLTPHGDRLEFEFNARNGALLSVKGQNIERARRK